MHLIVNVCAHSMLNPSLMRQPFYRRNINVKDAVDFLAVLLHEKCFQYWPDEVNEPRTGDNTRTIKHFHFLEWPDFNS
ncbi:hypothetical protein KUTeg_007346 [Tegillarca granosa]|uniref:Uncharacterized protein n=1 Tax=Tegillarca granosa TaxID=220873 RepID=A0ABQ9FF02_TEGGR|nr:hypothetical protein KUTeg_007346 [Tegillarca granosa]